MMHTRFDDEIREVEVRLASEREALFDGADRLTHTAKCVAASPKGLLAAAVVGFLIGELTRPRRRPSGPDQSSVTSKAVGLGGVLGGVALALVRAQFGSPLGMGKAALEYAAARRRARAAAASDAGAAGSIATSVADSPYTPPLPRDLPRT